MTARPMTSEELHGKLTGTRFWLGQLYVLLAGDEPDAMAAYVRKRLRLLKNCAPPDDGSIDAETFSRAIRLQFPFIQEVGDIIAGDLEKLAAQLADEKAESSIKFD